MTCSIEGCVNPSGVPGSARGWCRAHYRRWQTYGNVNEPLRKVYTWAGLNCSWKDCNKCVIANGLCDNHNKITRRKNDPQAQKIRNQAFAARLRKKQEEAMGRPRPALCEMCGKPPYGRGSNPEAGICFDHDHATEKPRGWLCDRCNKVLGLVQDDESLLIKMASYLEINKYGKVDDKAA